MTIKITNLLAAGTPVRDGAWTTTFMTDLSQILFYIFVVVGSVAFIYAFYLGFLLAKATDEAQRAKAKKRIHHAVASLLIIVILVTAFFTGGFTEAIFKNVRDINYYQLNSKAFMLGDVNGSNFEKKTVYLIQNERTLTENVEFKISAEEQGHNHAHSSDIIGISPAGVLSATAEASGKQLDIYVDVLYKGETKLNHQKITVYDETPNPGDPGDPGDPFVPIYPPETPITPQEAMFQNPINYTSTESDLEYYGSGHAPYVMTNFLDATSVPEFTSTNSFGVTNNILSTLSELDDVYKPHVFYNRTTGIIFHNMGSENAPRDIFAARIGEVTKIVDGIPDSEMNPYNGNGNYIEIKHEINDYDYEFDMQKWAVPLLKGKIVIPVSDLLGKKKIFYTRYYNLKMNSITVKVGDIVGGKKDEVFNGKKTIRPYGQPIASMGKSGYIMNNNSAQMYFEVLTYVDARNWLSSLLGKAFDFITGSDGGEYTHTVYINPFRDDEIVFVDNSDLSKQIKKATKQKKAWLVYNINNGYQMFNGAGGLIDSILKKGYKSLFNKDIQEAITALEEGDFKQFLKKEIRELLNDTLKEEMESFLYQKVADTLGAEYSRVLKCIVDGNFEGLLNPAVTGDLTQLLLFSMHQIISDTLLKLLEMIRPDLSDDTRAKLDLFLNTKVDFVLEMLDTEERIANGEELTLTASQRTLQNAIATLFTDDAFSVLLPSVFYEMFKTVLRLDLNNLIDGNQFAYNETARGYVTSLKFLRQANIVSSIPRNLKYIVQTGDFTSILNPGLRNAADQVLNGNMEALLDGGLTGALNIIDGSGNLSKLFSFDYQGLMDELKNFSLEGELERQIENALEEVLGPEVFYVLKCVRNEDYLPLLSPTIRPFILLLMDKPMREVLSITLRSKLEMIIADPSNGLNSTQRGYITLFLDAGLKEVLKLAQNNAPDEGDIPSQSLNNAITFMKNDTLFRQTVSLLEYDSLQIAFDVEFSRLYKKATDPLGDQPTEEQVKAMMAFGQVEGTFTDEIDVLYDGSTFIGSAKSITEGFAFTEDLWKCEGVCGSQWTNYSDYDPVRCKYCHSYEIKNISFSQNMTSLLHPVLRDALREIRDTGIKDMLNFGWDKVKEEFNKIKTSFKKIWKDAGTFFDKIDEVDFKTELQKVMKKMLTPNSYSIFEDATNGDFEKLLDGNIVENLKNLYQIQMRDIIVDELKMALLEVRGYLAPSMQENLDTFLKTDIFDMLNYMPKPGETQDPAHLALQETINALRAEPRFHMHMNFSMYQAFLVVLELNFDKFVSGETDFAYNASAKTLILKLKVLYEMADTSLNEVLKTLSFKLYWKCDCGVKWKNNEETDPVHCPSCYGTNIEKENVGDKLSGDFGDRLKSVLNPSIQQAIDDVVAGDFSKLLNGDLERAINTYGGFDKSLDILMHMDLGFKDLIETAKNIDLTQLLSPDAAKIFKDVFNKSTLNYIVDKFEYLTNGGLKQELKNLGENASDLWKDAKETAINFVKKDLKDYFKSDEFENDILSAFSSELKDAVAGYKGIKEGFENGWKNSDDEIDWGAVKKAAESFVDMLFGGGWTAWKTAAQLKQQTTKDGKPASFEEAFNEALDDLTKGLEEQVKKTMNAAAAEITGGVYKCSDGHVHPEMPANNSCPTCGATVKEYRFSCSLGHLLDSMPEDKKCPICRATVKENGLLGIFNSLDERLIEVVCAVAVDLEDTLLEIGTELNSASKAMGDQIVSIVDEYIKMSEIMEAMLVALAQEYYTARASLNTRVAIIQEDNGATGEGNTDPEEENILLVNIRGGSISYYENDDGTVLEVPAHIAPGKRISELTMEELWEVIEVLLTNNYVLGELRGDVIEEMIKENSDKFKEEENEDGSIKLWHKPDAEGEWEEISANDFMTEYETEIEEAYEAKLLIFLDEMEHYVSAAGYSDIDETIEGMDRLAEISSIIELRDVAVYMINYVFGGDPNVVITGDTCLKIKNNWWKKAFKVLCTVFSVINTIAGVVLGFVGKILVASGGFTWLGVIALSVAIALSAAAGAAGAMATDMIIPDKVVIGGNISISQHAKRIIGNPKDFGYSFSNQNEFAEQFDDYYAEHPELKRAVGEFLFGSPVEVDFYGLAPGLQTEFIRITYEKIISKFDREDYSKRILKFYLIKIDEGLEENQKVTGKLMGDAASELINPRVADMQDDINQLVDREMENLEANVQASIGDLGTKIRDKMKAELLDLKGEINVVFENIVGHFVDLGGSIEELLVETLEDLIQDLTEILVEMVLEQILGDLINNLCGDFSGIMTIVFPPDPISWYYPYERGIQIDIVEAVMAYFGVRGAKWSNVVQAVVRNRPYLQHYEQGPPVPQGYVA